MHKSAITIARMQRKEFTRIHRKGLRQCQTTSGELSKSRLTADDKMRLYNMAARNVEESVNDFIAEFFDKKTVNRKRTKKFDAAMNEAERQIQRAQHDDNAVTFGVAYKIKASDETEAAGKKGPPGSMSMTLPFSTLQNLLMRCYKNATERS